MVRRWPTLLMLGFIFLGFLMPRCGSVWAGEGFQGGGSFGSNDGSPSSFVVQPRELDLGVIGPGETVQGIFYLRNASSGWMAWYTEGPEGWARTENAFLTGSVGKEPEPLKISVTFQFENPSVKSRIVSLIVKLESADSMVLFRRQAQLGPIREAIPFRVPGGTRIAFFQIRLAELVSGALLDATPLQLDYGKAMSGETVSRRVLLTNRGREALTWKAGLAGDRDMPEEAAPLEGHYVAYKNEALAGAGTYLPSPALRDALTTNGPWGEEGGFPAAEGEQKAFRHRFTGTGISLFIWKGPDGGPFNVFLDEQFVDLIDGYSERRERVEIPIVKAQPEGPHVLTIVTVGGRLVLDGARIYDGSIQKGPKGWLTLFPNSGVTTRETDYVSISLNTRHLLPGRYGDRVFIESNGGLAEIELFLEVAADPQRVRLLDVHRYLSGSDYLYTTDPQGEQKRLQAKGYRYLGVAFRLFRPGTPGTTEFYRWFHPGKGDHFYSHDLISGGKSLTGYHYEGSIGFIATSRLTATRPLYRWFHPVRGLHFYTTDEGGEGVAKRGYRFDGIAGFVR